MAEQANFSTKDVYNDYAAQSKDQIAKGGKNVVINLREKFNVEFTKEFRGFKKGDQLKGISKVMYDLYEKNKVIKKIN